MRRTEVPLGALRLLVAMAEGHPAAVTWDGQPRYHPWWSITDLVLTTSLSRHHVTQSIRAAEELGLVEDWADYPEGWAALLPGPLGAHRYVLMRTGWQLAERHRDEIRENPPWSQVAP
jgi:hypothetical protein